MRNAKTSPARTKKDCISLLPLLRTPYRLPPGSVICAYRRVLCPSSAAAAARDLRHGGPAGAEDGTAAGQC